MPPAAPPQGGLTAAISLYNPTLGSLGLAVSPQLAAPLALVLTGWLAGLGRAADSGLSEEELDVSEVGCGYIHACVPLAGRCRQKCVYLPPQSA